MCIGVACSLIGLAIITNSIEGKILAMTVTVHHTCACVLGIAGEFCCSTLGKYWKTVMADCIGSCVNVLMQLLRQNYCVWFGGIEFEYCIV